MNISYHFITVNNDKILKALESNELHVINEYELKLKNILFFQKQNEKINSNNPKQPLLTNNVTIDDLLPQMIVKRSNNILSVYPIITKLSQMDNYPKFLYFDARNIIYKYGWLLIYYNNVNDELSFELNIKKNNITTVVMKKGTIPNNYLDLNIESILPQQIFMTLSQIKLNETINISFNIPIFLPLSWKDKWVVNKQTKYFTFCL